MSNDIQDKNFPFSGSAKGLSMEEDQQDNSSKQDVNTTKNTSSTISSDDLSLSSLLINLRNSMNLNIEQLSEITKIRPEFIEALENEDFSKLPGLVFAKGFVKNLARFYKIKDDSLIKAFDRATSHETASSSKEDSKFSISSTLEPAYPQKRESSKDFKVEDILEDSKSRPSSKGGSGQWKKLLKYATAVLVLFIISVVVTSYFSSKNQESSQDLASLSSDSNQTESEAESSLQEQTNSNQSENAVEDNEVQTQTSLVSTPQQPETQPQQPEQPQANTEAQSQVLATPIDPSSSTVSISSSCETEIRTKIDQTPWKKTLTQVGQTDIKFQNVFQIFITDSSCISISTNGVKLDDLSSKGKERRLTFWHNKVPEAIN